jgi:hypothetical protein
VQDGSAKIPLMHAIRRQTRCRAVAVQSWSPDGGASPGALQDTLAFLRRTGTLDADDDAGRMFDRRYLVRALRELEDVGAAARR